jgi:glycosyl hydrolase family 2
MVVPPESLCLLSLSYTRYREKPPQLGSQEVQIVFHMNRGINIVEMTKRILPGFLLILLLSLTSCGDADIPRPEHPRPNFERAQWLNLNGPWEFRFDPQNKGLDEVWQRDTIPWEMKINVPFCWESKLSGIQDETSQQIGWYRREISVPSTWDGQRVWLRFEAVDWEAQVWVNDAPLGQHAGGYTPFAFDITDRVKPGESATVVVRAYDPTDRELPTGKQVVSWYTFTSGIWQTVWLEARPQTYVEDVTLVPQREGDNWSLAVEVKVTGGSGSVKVSSPDTTVSSAEGDTDGGVYTAELAVSSPKLWTPDEPNLYDLNIEVTSADGATDAVKTYFGLRTVGRGRYGDADYESVLLNGEPIYLKGALDQSFNPDGIYTAPTDEFLRRDMELAKQAGLNFLRIHIKPDEPRRLYWADKLGVLIMEDMPNTWEQTSKARAAWQSTAQEVMARDKNHPSIFSWCLFNETWGLGGNEYKNLPEVQEWVKQMWREAKAADPTRLIEDNSANRYDHVIGDINSWHFYIDDEERARKHIDEVVAQTYPGSTFNYAPGHRQDTAPLINSEYGAVSSGGGDRDISWGFRYLTTQLRKHEKIQGYIYTELSDIEFEHNGFYNYDRSPKEFGYEAWVENMTVADLQRDDFVGFDSPPLIVVSAGEQLSIPAFVSHWSDVEGEIFLKRWLIGVDDLGREVRVDLDMKPVTWEKYRVTQQLPLEVTMPDRPFSGALAMELVDDDENRLAANFVNLVVESGADTGRQRVGREGEKLVALRVSPRANAASRWSGAGSNYRANRRGNLGKNFIVGSGTIEYRFKAPAEVLAANPVRLGLFIELGTRARDERLDWPQQTTPLDRPQTDVTKHPGEVHIYINGHPLEPIPLMDDPADARGLLSHQAKFEHGSYGYLVKGEIYLQGLPSFVPQLKENPEIRVVLVSPEGETGAGLSVYGAASGRYPIDPTVVLETERPIVW